MFTDAELSGLPVLGAHCDNRLRDRVLHCPYGRHRAHLHLVGPHFTSSILDLQHADKSLLYLYNEEFTKGVRVLSLLLRSLQKKAMAKANTFNVVDIEMQPQPEVKVIQ